jgi:hypothetical protein
VPSLLGAHFERFQAFGEAIGEAVEGWLGCASHPDREPYVRLVATVSLAAVWAAILSWYDEHAHDGAPVEPGALPRMMAANFAAVRAGLALTAPGMAGEPAAVAAGLTAARAAAEAAQAPGGSGGTVAASTALAAQGTT